MSIDTAPAPAPGHAPEPPTRRRRRWPYALVALTMLAGTALAWGYHSLSGNITSIDTSGLLGENRPAKLNGSQNILLIGSDTREGQNAEYPGDSPGLSDTTIVLHLSEDGTWGKAVSIPRDSMVQMPECVTPSGEVHPAGLRQFNWSYSIGGPACTQKTVEATTGLHIDHFVVLDFTGFTSVVDALGGVEMCFDEAVSVPSRNLDLKAGCQTLDGETALQYVRVRKGIGDGSDLQRITRQQGFLSAVADQVTSAETLRNPVTLYDFLDKATSAITADADMSSISDLVHLAQGMRATGSSNLDFVMVPITGYAPDPNRVAWDEAAAEELWTQLAVDANPVAASNG
jgi:LCP family protein required for cell wall assembly